MVNVRLEASDTERYGPIYRGDMLDKVKEDRVFAIEQLDDGKVMLYEMCDEYFGRAMTSDELRSLAAELLAVADLMPDPPGRTT